MTALAIAAPVSASTSAPVTITVLTDFDGSAPFTATSDVVCDTGIVFDASVLFTSWQSNRHAQILVGKHFVCEDGSGTFDITLHVTLDFSTGNTWGTWNVSGGTGDYAQLRGTGAVTGINGGDDTILDVYTGEMHIN